MNTQPIANARYHSRLTDAQYTAFRREGFIVYDKPIFSVTKFDALKAHFEDKLARLPSDVRPEAMDVPHFTDTKLFNWLFADEVLDLVEPLLGPDIALWSSHFICKPKGDGKRIPWHEDSAYWADRIQPMEVVTVWLAIDPSTTRNGCMYVIPQTHFNGFSDYDPVDPKLNAFSTEITPTQRNDALAVPIELAPNHASLHDSKLMHGSPPNQSEMRRCGYTMRYMPTTSKINEAKLGGAHQIYLARGRDRAGNNYADPTRSYNELARYREASGKKIH
jgi:hypothetical protein